MEKQNLGISCWSLEVQEHLIKDACEEKLNGLWKNMPMKEYKKIPAVNQSSLKRLFFQSPRHFEVESVDEKEKSEALKFGSAAHCAILEPEKFWKEYVIMPEGIDRRTKSGKEAYAEFERAAEGREIITAETQEAIKGICESLSTKKLISQLLTGGEAEVSIFWIDQDTGLQLKGRVDYLKPEFQLIADLKTTRDASSDAFQMDATRYRYYWQAGYYMDGLERASGGFKVDNFVYVAVEKTVPYELAAYKIDGDSIELGRQEYKEALSKYGECKRLGQFLGYPDFVQSLRLKEWALRSRLKNE